MQSELVRLNSLRDNALSHCQALLENIAEFDTLENYKKIESAMDLIREAVQE